MTAPYPLIFEPVLLEKVWGGRRLAALGKPLAGQARIGESWELADLATTAAGGAGGQPVHSRIVNGELRGQTIRDAILKWGSDLLGPVPLTAAGGFPLLVKFLDARENLSLQVHPSPAYAARHPGAHVKSECWYILDAQPGSLIYKGLKPGVTPDLFRRHLEEGRAQDDITAVPAVRGDCHFLPSGTCHALGAGVLVAEVQTASDTTFRVYDWGRTDANNRPRELHVEPAMACIDWGPAPSATRLPAGHRAARLVKTDSFVMDECVVPLGESEPAALAGGCAIVIVLEGEGELVGAGAAVKVQQGDTALVPAAVAASTVFKSLARARLLRVVPVATAAASSSRP